MLAFVRTQRFAVMSIFFGGLILFTTGLSQEIIGFESRFYLFALEMWRHGIIWFPTTYGVYYPDYPPTTTWLIVGAARVFNHLDKWAAVFPSAVAAAVTLVFTYLIGSLQNKSWGWFAVFFLMLTNAFLMEARTISPDQYITMVTTICFYVVYSAELFQKKRRLVFLPILLLFGFACRGPIGLVVPAGVLCSFYLLDKKFAQLILVIAMACCMLLVGCVALLGIAHYLGGMQLVHDVIRMQVSGRLEDAYLPWYFYFSESLGAYAVTYPLALLAMVGLFFHRVRNVRQQQFLHQLCGWVVVILIGLSIPAGKKVRYILAVSPALALLTSYIFVAPTTQKYFFYLKRIVYWISYFLPIICFAMILILEVITIQRQLTFSIAYLYLSNLFLLLQWVAWFNRRNEVVIIGIAALTFLLSVIFIVDPINLALNRTHDFVQQVESMRQKEHAALVFYHENPDGMPIKYIVNMSREEKPFFIENTTALAKWNRPAYFVTDEEYFSQLPNVLLRQIEIKNTGKVGHDRVVVFIKKNHNN